MANPKPGDPGYQEWLNQQVVEHDKRVQRADANADTATAFFAGAHTAETDLKKGG